MKLQIWWQRWKSSRSKGESYSVFKSVMRITLYSTIAALFLASLLGYKWLETLGVFKVSETEISSITEFKASDNSIVLDNQGKKIGEFFDRYHIFVPYKNIPKEFVHALISIEDKNFFEHSGVDVKGMFRAALMFLRHGKYQQGASTITQQLVRNFILSREKTINRKVREIALAMKLESSLGKERILELYCNTLFLGNGSYGIGAAAKRYFGKPLGDLELHEFALIAGLFQSPSRYNPQKYPKLAKKRQKQVITAMFRNKYLSRDDAIAWLKKPLVYVPYEPMNEKFAPYFIDHVREETSEILGAKVPENRGLRIYTSLDTNLQTVANKTVAEATDVYEQAEKGLFRQYRKKKSGQVEEEYTPIETALLSIDSISGGILAMVGGRDYDHSKYNRTTQSLRSPGSAFKPIVYSLALHEGFTWADQVFVTPVSIRNYRPKNFGDSDYLTESTLLRSFYKSMNSTTIQIGKKLQLPAILGYAKKMGVETPLKDEPGTMLGGSEVSMFDLARVYSVFSNYGRKPNIHSIQKIEDRSGKVLYVRDPKKFPNTKVISPEQAYLMTKGMQAVLKNGTASSASGHSGYAAGKTGTSNEAKDNWFCGYTRNMTTIVWLGTDNSIPIYGKATGGDLALPIWDRYMTEVANKKLRKMQGFWKPNGVVSATVHPQFGHRSPNGMRMYFLNGTAPSETNSDLEVISSTGGYRDVFGH